MILFTIVHIPLISERKLQNITQHRKRKLTNLLLIPPDFLEEHLLLWCHELVIMITVILQISLWWTRAMTPEMICIQLHKVMYHYVLLMIRGCWRVSNIPNVTEKLPSLVFLFVPIMEIFFFLIVILIVILFSTERKMNVTKNIYWYHFLGLLSGSHSSWLLSSLL